MDGQLASSRAQRTPGCPIHGIAPVRGTEEGDPQGMITQDRLVGIKGSVGATSGYPVTLTVRNAAGVTVDRRNSTVVLPDAGPSVAANVVGNAVIEDLDNYYNGTLRFAWQISYRTEDGVTGTPGFFIDGKEVGNQDVKDGKLVPADQDSSTPSVWSSADLFETYIIKPAFAAKGISLD